MIKPVSNLLHNKNNNWRIRYAVAEIIGGMTQYLGIFRILFF